MHNAKYLGTVTELVKEQFAPKLLQWVAELSEENKKGLRVLKTILELKGEKRFRRQKGAQGASVDVHNKADDMDVKDYNAAKQTFRKMSTKSSYNRQFGERPKEEEAYHIVKKKRFSEIDFSSILKPGPCAMVEKWIIGDSDDEFVSRVFFTLRDIYTIVRSKSNFETTNRERFIDAPKYVA